MGIIVSIPQVGGPVSVLPQSTTISPSSYLISPTGTNAFNVSPAVFDQPKTESALVVTISGAQEGKSLRTGVTTDFKSVECPDPWFSETITTYLSTATVTSTIESTHLVVAKATILATRCPNTTTVFSRTSFHLGSKGAVSSQRSLSTGVTHSRDEVSSVLLARIYTPGISSLMSHITKIESEDLSPVSRTISVPIGRSSGSARSGSASYIYTKHSLAGGHVTALLGSVHSSLSRGPFVESTHIQPSSPQITPQTLTLSNPCIRFPTRTATEIVHFTTTTVHKSTVVNRTTTTTTITTLPGSCLASQTATSNPTTSTSCTSAIPNPNPPSNDTCAEDGLLEYASTLRTATTLDGCAVACLADPSCLSFTFVPSQSACSTSLYPLADSAFAGVQQYHIYNYDRDCYLCSS